MKDIDTPLPPDELGRRLTEVYDLVGPLYRRAQRSVEQGLDGARLSLGVRAVLTLLHRNGPMTVPQMGRAQAISRQFVQRMVNDAAAQHLVESVPNPAHRRSPLIRPTRQGAEAIAAVLESEHRLLRETGGGLTEADVTACLRVLGELLRALDHVDTD
ncbi:MarR family winged helix-turn-helix transcriptional regulator [Streptomyces pilosus]|uniref:MarR family transcriptional regulator n=1 Tax=Streptomyces pilosus TaxID=28893 RepID=A0A918BHM3_9ACTN|nr:MarR family winged helix-turn-helix transcriptional regulator [Streptomyces pilosus]GGQ67870.1 MarR family transcriptional regulator [Streptomyces pilosus]GGV53750.1 MarR family transcriptional regulator [Streptomyces pilosus]